MFQITKSTAKNKKWSVFTPEGKKINFGDSRYEDYTQHKDDDRMHRYLIRHQGEDWDDLDKAGTWSRFILWNKPSISTSIKNMEKHFKIKISFQQQ